MIALLGWLMTLVVVEVMCHVPFLMWGQYRAAQPEWIALFKEPIANRFRLRLRYWAAMGQIFAVGLLVQAVCASWMVMAGTYSGFFVWTASVVKAAIER